MPDIVVTEDELRAPERLSAQGDFAGALPLSQEMLRRVHDDNTRIRLLLNVVICSTSLGMSSVANDAILELEKLPEAKISHVYVNFFQAVSYLALGRAQEALELIDANFKSGILARDDLQVLKYEHLAYKGRALVFLARCEEALVSLAEGHTIYPDGKRETDILIDQANCLMALGQYDGAFDAARQVTNRDDGRMAGLAMQYMAESRRWQGRLQEAVKLYLDLKKRLPCEFVNEKRIEEGMNQCIASLEKIRGQNKPS